MKIQNNNLDKQKHLFVLQKMGSIFINDVLSEKNIKKFQSFVWNFYKKFGRNFEWRESITPYRIVVSEIMLQQTQTSRVIPKFLAFIDKFSTFSELAYAEQAEVLKLWQGLGYNRRALALHSIAKKVVTEFNGILPDNPDTLETFPGIGKATAASICAFAFNRSTIFIETNIRAVFTHYFFQDQDFVADKDLMPLIGATVDKKDPRQWYYALMDIGVILKKIYPNLGKKNKHYTKQSKFIGSNRQIRGALIKLLLKKPLTIDECKKKLQHLPQLSDEKFDKIVNQLCSEGFIIKKNKNLFLL